MARKPKGKKKTGSLSVNFKGVDGKRSLLPEDDYLVEVEEATEGESSSGNPMITFVFAVSEGKHKGAKLWLYCPLEEKSLWKLRGVLEALGEEVPDDEMDIELDDLIGKELMAVVSHESYDGAKRAKLVDFYAVGEGDDAEDDDDEEETPSKKSKNKKADKKPSKKSKDEDEDEDGEEDEETDEEAADDKAAKRKARRLARKGGKPEKEEKSSKKAAKPEKKSKKKETYSADDIQGLDEDELEEVIEKTEIEVDLSDFKTLKKKQAAVIDALEDADLLEAGDEEDDD